MDKVSTMYTLFYINLGGKMKRRIYFGILFLLLCFPIVTKALATNANYNTANLYFFCEKENSECDSGREWLENELMTNIQININAIKIEDNQELYDKVKKSLKVKSKKLPFIVIGTNAFTGLSDTNKEHLKEAIAVYQDAEGACDLVSTIKNEGDVKACIKQNKKIYKTKSHLLIYSLSAIGIIVIIGAILFVRKKNLK